MEGGWPGRDRPWEPAGALTVLVVDRHEVVARGLALLLQREGVEIAGTASTAGQATVMLDRRRPRVALVDSDLTAASGLEVIPAAHKAGTRVLVLTDDRDTRALAAATATGADGVASKVGSLAELVGALRAVAGGESFVDPRFADREISTAPPKLTPRERQVVALLAGGLRGDDIAERLYLSPGTVRTHIRNAMARLGARTRAHLVALAAVRQEIELPRR